MENKDIQFHITVKGIVIYEGKTLILKRVRPSSDGLGYWELPGGGLEYGEDPHQALVRELKEETGLDIEIIKPVYTFTAIRPHYQTVGIGFLCIPTNDQVKISFEHTDYKFVDEDELEKTLDPHIFNDIKKTIEEYKEIRDRKIQKWIDENFIDRAVTWEMDGANAIKVTDKTGDSMVVQLDEID